MRKKWKLLRWLVFQAQRVGGASNRGAGPVAALLGLKLAAAGKGHPTVSITCCYLENLISCPEIDLLSSPV